MLLFCMGATAEIHDLRRARKRQPVPIPADACKIISYLGGDVPATVTNVRFRLTTLRKGVEIMLSVPGFSWNLSHTENYWPASFKEARRWIAAYAARYGQTFEEVVRPRSPVGSRADRALLKAGGCKEEWLRSDVPALFGEAAVRCQHAGAYCMSDGFCRLGGCDMVMEPQQVTVDEDD